MKNRYKSVLIGLTACFLFIQCTVSSKITFVEPGNKKIQAEGRVGSQRKDVSEIYWPGSGFTIRFKGTALKAILKDERGKNYFNVIVDGKLTDAFRVDTTKKTYTIVSGLSDTIHTVALLKRADWFRGKTWFYGFETAAGSRTFHLPDKKRMIEFYGNSITVGAAVEDYKRDSGDSTYTNNYSSYAAITARHFNAGYSCIASSGIGLLVSWGSLIMTDIYDRLDPDDSTSKWNFSKATPDIVVINLLQNDYALVNLPDHSQFKRRFGDKAPSEEIIIKSYARFVKNIRNHYPDAYIVCVLGTMDAVQPGSSWPGYIEKAVLSLRDKKIKTHFFPYKNTPHHPKTNEQQKMADELISFIEQNIQW